jgi:hypothetical protein
MVSNKRDSILHKLELIFANLATRNQHWRHLFTYKFLLIASPFTSVHIEEKSQLEILKVIVGTIITMQKTYHENGKCSFENLTIFQI